MSHPGSLQNKQPMNTPPMKVGDYVMRHCAACNRPREHWVVGYSEVYEPLGIFQIKYLELKIRVSRGFDLI